MKSPFTSDGVHCPFCKSKDDCKHFIGWTKDGIFIDFRLTKKAVESKDDLIHNTDKIVTTGVTARVYRKG